MSEGSVQEEQLVGRPLVGTSGMSFKEFYPVNPPFGFVGIQIDEDTGKAQYITFEPSLDEEEEELLASLKETLLNSADLSLELLNDEKKLDGYLRVKMDQVFKRFKRSIPDESREKFIYYLMRDFLGYGKIDLLMKDPNIEDISCNGIDTPIYVWHRNHESLPSNVKYESAERLNFIVTRIVYKTGNQISIAHPILEGTLPEGYRAHVTLDEVSKRGDTFTIRKFQPDPYTIIDLINFGTITPRIAAYFWILIEHLRSLMVVGAVASGKTSMLNAMCMFIRPEMKVVTIEEVRELRLHENWIPLTTRTSFQPGVQEVTLFELLKSALRQRPDYIIVGEVRGEEAYTLFQSIAVGHGGLCTAHADSIDSIIQRLTARPMDIPEAMIPLMNVLVQIRRVEYDGVVARKAVEVTELIGIDDNGRLLMDQRFAWEGGDNFKYNRPDENEKSIFKLISQRDQIPFRKLEDELDRREIILQWMVKTGTKSYEDVAELVRNYYLNPDEVYNIARMGVLS